MFFPTAQFWSMDRSVKNAVQVFLLLFLRRANVEGKSDIVIVIMLKMGQKIDN